MTHLAASLGTFTLDPSTELKFIHSPVAERGGPIIKNVEAAMDAARGSIERLLHIPPDPFAAISIPPFSVPEPEEIPMEWANAMLTPGECRMGERCLGLTLQEEGGGYRVRPFRTPKGRDFTSLCLLCLNFAVTRNSLKGRGHVLFTGIPPFRISQLEFKEGAWSIEF